MTSQLILRDYLELVKFVVCRNRIVLSTCEETGIIHILHNLEDNIHQETDIDREALTEWNEI